MSAKSNINYHALRSLRKDNIFKEGDILVLFGELFSRGYANGLVEEAEKRGMKIIRSTVGRRDKDGSLRALHTEEIADTTSFINIPLEAGFDLEPGPNGICPADFLKDIKLSNWESADIPDEVIMFSKIQAQKRFRENVRKYICQLKEILPSGKNILFAHLMAGGVPRTKIVMPLMNRVFKGIDDRHLSSLKFWESNIGKFCAENFIEVTANTFNILIEETASIRAEAEADGRRVSYIAYGYHGTEVLMNNNYMWQTYTPYVQGWAKIQLENYSRAWNSRGVHCCAYNCPEILTNSSSIFQGVENSLYALIGALKKEQPETDKVKYITDECDKLLKESYNHQDIIKVVNSYLMNPIIRGMCNFEKWPEHNEPNQMKLMIDTSNQLIDMHKDHKHMITSILSELVFSACGKIIINDASVPESPVSWLNHDIIAKIRPLL